MMEDWPPNSAPPPWNPPGVPAWLLGLYRPLPEPLYTLRDPVRDRFCFRKLGGTEDCGLLVWSAPHLAQAYAAACLAATGFREVRFLPVAEACTLAFERHPFVNCVALVDDPRQPRVQYVR